MPKDEKNPEKKSAAKIIADTYRGYLEKKSTLVQKKELLPKKVDSLPTSRSKENEKSALFFHVKNDEEILFTQSGAATLFPIDPETKKVFVNLKLLNYYINKGKDIRPMVLEAYLRDRIDNKHTLMSLFLIQQGLHEFYPKNTKIPKPGPVQIFPIHKNGILTSEATTKLLPYLISSSPPISRLDTNKEKFMDDLKFNLSQLPISDNYFAYVEIPLNEIYKLAYSILYDVKIKENIFDKKFKNAKVFFQYVASTLGLELDMRNSKLAAMQLKHSFMELLENKLLKILADEKIRIKITELKNYMYEHLTLFHLLTDSALKETGEFLPIVISSGKKCQFFLPIIGSSTQNAWLKASTGKEPEELLEKVPMLGTISVSSLHQMANRRQRPIGLEKEEIETPDLVHNAISKHAYAYSGHDARFHYQVLFYLLANAYPIYELQIKLAQVIRDTIRHEISYAVVNMLDFANGYYAYLYTGAESPTNHIKLSSFIPLPKDEEAIKPAMLEYAFIIACYMIKNENEYLDILHKLPGEPVKHNEVLQLLLDDYEIDANRILPYKDAIKNYSNSLGAFMCMLLIHEYDREEIKSLCDKIDKLEKEGNIIFKWNKKDGMMVNFDNQSFRFRSPIAKDYRSEIKYPQDRTIRKLSTDSNWWRELNEAVNAKASLSLRK